MNNDKYMAAVKKIGEEVDHLFAEGTGPQELVAALFTVGVAKIRRAVDRGAVEDTVKEMTDAALKATDPNNHN